MTVTRAKSAVSHQRARSVMPGGVSSPVRAYVAVGGQPITAASGQGPWVTDVDGNRYIDYVGSYGPLILGHAHPDVVAAIGEAAARGSSFGMPSETESTLAEMIVGAVESIDLVRFVNSGTEATMSSIRLARAATGRDKIIKCIGCYHGHSDGLLLQAGSGATTLGVPSSPGVPALTVRDTVLVPYNDSEAVARVFEELEGQVAGVIVEPIAGNMGCVPPAQGYLEALREVCDRHGGVLIFDEVMTGFRVAYGGAQSVYGVRPDLTCLGKVIGGGLPCAAYGGGEELMRRVAPDGPVYQAGTLSGNPLAMAAGIATLSALREPGVYDRLDAAAGRLAEGLVAAARGTEGAGVPVTVNRVGSMVWCGFTDHPIRDYDGVTSCDTERFARFFHGMLDQGVMLPPSQFETWFVSTAHDEACIEQTIAASSEAFTEAVQGTHV